MSDVVTGSQAQVAPVANSTGASVSYALVTIGPDTGSIVNATPASLSFVSGNRLRGSGGAPEIRLGVGDTVNISIFEAAAEGGLFSKPGTATGGTNVASLAPQTIDRSGTLTVPFAGDPIPAAGRTVREVQQEIRDRLRNRAVDPQAMITVADRRSNLVTIIGDVNATARIPVDQAGLRVLDAIASAGGSKYPSYETSVTLTRNGRRGTRRLSQIMNSPGENAFVAPGDTIEVQRVQRFYNVIGAAGRNGRVDFEAERVTLADAVARAGGLLDDRADAAAVFIYRPEARRTAENLGLDLHAFSGSMIPIVYRLNLRDPGTVFAAQNFQMREGDFILVSNAPSVDILKFITVVRGFTGVARDVSGFARDIQFLNTSSTTNSQALVFDDTTQ